jgi:hypothetical protein|tara:strand:+ start:813 stop:995 length:183 start_codon:yes stop_codon:yes gene_type:complete
MKYYKATLFNPGPPIDLEDTTIVYLEAEDSGDLLIVSLDSHNKPVKEWEEVSKDVYDANN